MKGKACWMLVLVLAVTGLGFLSAAADAEDLTVCEWGGTPAAATGTVTIKPGLTNTPSARPSKVVASGDMACSDGFAGFVTFRGVAEAGSTCAVQVFDLKVQGLPGVVRAYGPGAGGLVHEFLYDKGGNVVGADQPQVFSGANAGGSELADCATEQGFTETIFSSTVELWR